MFLVVGCVGELTLSLRRFFDGALSGVGKKSEEGNNWMIASDRTKFAFTFTANYYCQC